jgi:hypothetical protein
MKKSKKSDSPLVTEPHPLPLTSKPIDLAVTSLQEIRDKALRERFATSQIIAELDAWRNEIDATLAFLKAQR